MLRRIASFIDLLDSMAARTISALIRACVISSAWIRASSLALTFGCCSFTAETYHCGQDWLETGFSLAPGRFLSIISLSGLNVRSIFFFRRCSATSTTIPFNVGALLGVIPSGDAGGESDNCPPQYG